MKIRYSIFKRLTLIFSIFSILIITIIAILLYCFAVYQLKRDFYNYNTHLLKNVADYYDEYLVDLHDFVQKTGVNASILRKIEAGGEFTPEMRETLKTLPSLDKNLWIKNIEFYVPGRNQTVVVDETAVTVKEADYSDQYWYKNLSKQDEWYAGGGYQKSGVFFTFAEYIKAPKAFYNEKIIILLNIDKRMAEKLESMIQVRDGEMVFLYHEGKNLLYTNTLRFLVYETYQKIVSKTSEFVYQGKAYLKVTSISESGVVFTKLSPQNTFLDIMRPMLVGVGIVIFVFAGISITFAYFAAKNTTANVYRLLDAIEKVSDGDFDLPNQSDMKDEIGIISQKIGEMAIRIQELLHTEYILMRNEQKALMKALEARVNPHFLNNSLQAISGRAFRNGDYEMCSMINSLADMYRYCISTQSSVTILDEVENARQYVSIGQFRFGDKLQVEFDVDFTALELTVPRLCLQIPIENSIKYALERTNKTVKILVRVRYYDGALYLLVEDDGAGIDAEELEKLQKKLVTEDYLSEESASTGLAGLYGRLWLIYGEAADLEVDSKKNEFFRTSIQIKM